jgi:two-component system, NtrC family, sensor histidine kinase HydH
LEDRLRQAEKLAYVGQMASKLAHELRNPLNTISINLQMLEEDMNIVKSANTATPAGAQPIDSDKLLRRINISRHEIQRLEHLLSNFLRFAKVVPTDQHPIDINQLLHTLVEFILPTAKLAKVEIIESLQSELPQVNLDEKLLKSALLNLVLNAIEAMPNGGTLTLHTAVASKSKKQVQLVVQDTGTGIPPENIVQVFDVFYTTKDDGSGLGLPIAKRIITDADGTIDIQSTVRQGTKITVTLPAV